MTSSVQPTDGFAVAVRELARPADLRALGVPALHCVMGTRLYALLRLGGQDPVVELATRLGSVAAAAAICELAEAVGRFWPERYTAGRPCCLKMTPDEQTLAAMARHAIAGDRDGFRATLDGFVRSARHDALFELTVRAVAAVASIRGVP
jgi:hypothetical protein